MIHFIVPGRPKGKQRVAQDSRGKGHRFAAKASVADELEIGKICRVAMMSARPFTGAVKLTIQCVFAIPASWRPELRAAALDGKVYHTQKPDCDNIAKLIKDALNKVAWHDDSQVAVELIRKRFGHPERVDIQIEELEPELHVPATPSETRRVEAASNRQLGLLGRKRLAHNAGTK